MIAEKHLTSTTAEAVALALAQVARCRADLSSATTDLEAARATREALDDTDPNSVIRADEAVRHAFRNRGVAADRLEHALDVLVRREREAVQ